MIYLINFMIRLANASLAYSHELAEFYGADPTPEEAMQVANSFFDGSLHPHNERFKTQLRDAMLEV